MVKELEFHPIANIFPLMQGKAFEELCEDIKANGLREPIWLYEDKILDGRNRYRGCDEIGYELKETDFRTYEGDDPYSFVGSLNVHRRHLTASQRALTVAHLVTATAGVGLKSGAITAAQAGRLVGVGASTVETARAVLRRGAPELIAVVESGQMSGFPARAVSGLTPDKQRAVLQRIGAIPNTDNLPRVSSIQKALRAETAESGRELRATPVSFIRDLDEMAVRILDFFTAPQIDILWDTIAKKQAEMIKARREKR